MATVACEVCADRYRRPVIGVVFAALLSPLVWGWAALTALARLGRPRRRKPRLCLLAGSRPLRRQTARALRRALDELERFETKTSLDLVLVQDRITRPDGEPLRAAVQRSRRGTTLLTIRLALHAHRTCYGPEAVAATLADVLVTLYEREAQSAAVLEVPARVPREAPTTLTAVASTTTARARRPLGTGSATQQPACIRWRGPTQTTRPTGLSVSSNLVPAAPRKAIPPDRARSPPIERTVTSSPSDGHRNAPGRGRQTILRPRPF